MMKGDEENTNRKLYINVHNYKDQNQSNSIKNFKEEGKENISNAENRTPRSSEHSQTRAHDPQIEFSKILVCL